MSGELAPEQVVTTEPRGLSGTLVPLGVADQFEPGQVPEGRRAFQGSRGTPESFSDDPLATTWGRAPIMPLTDAGREAISCFDGGSTDNPRLDCESTSILFDWSFDKPINRVRQTETGITLIYNLMNMERTIHLDRTDFPADLAPSRTGYSIGRWEGDVLTVRTRGFPPGHLSPDRNTPHSDALRVIERFSVDPENGALLREFEAEDGTYWTGVYRGRDVLYVSALPYEPHECDDRTFRTDISQ